jgi:dCMP deaminase
MVKFTIQMMFLHNQPKNNLLLQSMEIQKQNKYDKAYLRLAKEWSKLSYCKRKQVGAIIVRDRMIISDGYNGTPSGFENCCEDENNLTHWYVLHAEANAILKVARSTQTCEGATLYITMSPCKECSKLIHQSGIKRVVYLDGYKDNSGLEFLQKAGVKTEQIADID